MNINTVSFIFSIKQTINLDEEQEGGAMLEPSPQHKNKNIIHTKTKILYPVSILYIILLLNFNCY